MSKPKRIQRSRAKGWRMPPNTVYVGRPTKWGNPFVVGKHGTLEHCLMMFRNVIDTGYLYADAPKMDQIKVRNAVAKNLDDLRGHDLACWCPLNQPCHADVLLKIANS